MLPYLKRAARAIVYKYAARYVNCDSAFAAALMTEGLKDQNVREQIQKSEMQLAVDFITEGLKEQQIRREILGKDTQLAMAFITEGLKEPDIREPVLEEDIRKHKEYWLNQLKDKISVNGKAAAIAETYLLSQQHYRQAAIENLYQNGQLFASVRAYFKKDIHMLEQACHLLLETPWHEGQPDDYGLQQKVYQELADQILLGGISNCKYNDENGVFKIDGWFFPVCNYDKILVRQSGHCLGEAVLGMKRLDVYKNYPAGAEKYAGWMYQTKQIQIDLQKEITVEVYNKGRLIFCSRQKVQLQQTDGIWNGTINDYLLNVQNVKEDTDEARKRMRRFNEICMLLKEWMPWDQKQHYDKWIELREEIVFGKRRIEELFIEIFSSDHVIQFKHAKLRYQDAFRLWIIINELLVYQEYYFETDIDSPFIIDGGANIGLAIFYFKSLYPSAKIVAFEPSKAVYDILCLNIKENGWTNVQAYPYALDEEEQQCELLAPKDDCLGASLTSRPLEGAGGAEVLHETVICKKLSPYLTSAVDFLKLDIEGVEVRVLRELGANMQKVKRLFCEYHYGKTVKDNEFFELIRILETYGFVYQMSKSPSYQKSTEIKTMLRVGSRCSFNVWARNKELS